MAPTLPPPIRKSTPFKVPSKVLPPSPVAAPHVAKTFSIAVWDGTNEGQKILGYGASGDGKTTLASMAPDPVFIGLDDGGRMVRNPITGEAIRHVLGVVTFQDVRDILHQPGLFVDARSVVIDTGTALELLALQHVIDTVPHGDRVDRKILSIEDYGYGKGYQHMFDAMRLVFQDLDGLVRQGKNVIILCQQCPQVIANAAGSNYLQDGPKLYAPGPDSKQSFTTRGYACEWADHVVRIGYLSRNVVGARVDAKSGKEIAGKIRGDTTRAIFTMPTDPSFFAKTRTLTEPVVSFAAPNDNSFWRLLFPDAGLPEPEETKP